MELTLSHYNKIGDFKYSVSANYTYTNNEVTKLANVERDIAEGLFIGHSLTSIYAYVSDGLFVDQSDIDSYPGQPFAARPGDVRLKDIGGPGVVPDGVTDPVHDRTIIGNSMPRDIFGLSVNGEYKGIDFGVRLGGIAGLHKRVGGHAGQSFSLGSPPQQWMVDNRWSPENPDRNARYIRMTLNNQNPGSSHWYWDASFLKIQNINLGYTLPNNITSKIGISKLRFYLSGSDLAVFHKFWDGWDPEMNAHAGHYPTTATFVFGVNANF